MEWIDREEWKRKIRFKMLVTEVGENIDTPNINKNERLNLQYSESLQITFSMYDFNIKEGKIDINVFTYTYTKTDSMKVIQRVCTLKQTCTVELMTEPMYGLQGGGKNRRFCGPPGEQ